MSESPEQIDVTGLEDDSEKLKEKFKEATGQDNTTLYDWMSAGQVLMKGPYKNVAAVIIKLNSGHGAVRIFADEETIVGNFQTNPDAKDATIMVLLRPG